MKYLPLITKSICCNQRIQNLPENIEFTEYTTMLRFDQPLDHVIKHLNSLVSEIGGQLKS